MAPSKECKSCKCLTECDLLLWKNPVETAKYFVGALAGLLILRKINLITFFLRFFYTVFFTTGCIEFFSKIILGQGLVTKYGIKDCPNTVGFLKPHVDEFLKQLPARQAKMRMLVFAYVPKNNFKVAACLYCLHKIFSWFSVWTVMFCSVIAAFTVPIVYKTYQKQIDDTVGKICALLKEKRDAYTKVACKAAEPHLKKLEPLMKYLHVQPPTNESTTTKLAAEVPLEKPAESASASASASGAQFNVDELSSDLKQNTNSLRDEFQANQQE